MEIKAIRRTNLRILLKGFKTQKEFAEKADLAPGHVSQMVNGSRKMGDHVARKMETLLRLEPDWMDHEHGTKVNESNASYASVETNQVPVLSWVQAGQWTATEDNPQVDSATEWLPCPGPHSSSTFALKIVGPSMEDEFFEGEYIFVDPERIPKHNDFVVVQLDHGKETLFKQLKIEGGRKYLQAYNPNWPDRIIELTQPATIIGVAIYKLKKY